jgi:hypothetical protein
MDKKWNKNIGFACAKRNIGFANIKTNMAVAKKM